MRLYLCCLLHTHCMLRQALSLSSAASVTVSATVWPFVLELNPSLIYAGTKLSFVSPPTSKLKPSNWTTRSCICNWQSEWKEYKLSDRWDCRIVHWRRWWSINKETVANDIMEGITTADGMEDGDMGVRACPKTCQHVTRDCISILRIVAIVVTVTVTHRPTSKIVMAEPWWNSMQCAEGLNLLALVGITVQDVEGTCMHINAMCHPLSLM